MRRLNHIAPADRYFFRVHAALGLEPDLLAEIGIGRLESVEQLQPPAMQDSETVTMIADITRIVGDDHHRPVSAFAKELLIAPVVEARIANRADLVDQETVEFGYHRNGKGKPGPHAG